MNAALAATAVLYEDDEAANEEEEAGANDEEEAGAHDDVADDA